MVSAWYAECPTQCCRTVSTATLPAGMPIVAIFLSQGGLGDCAQHAVAHALADESVTVRAIAREAKTVGHIDKEKEPFLSQQQLTNPRFSQHIIAYDADTPEVAAQLTAVLDGVDAVIAAPSNRQPWKERKAGGSMKAICKALTSRHATTKRLVFLTTMGVDGPAIPWTPVGKIMDLMFKISPKTRPDFRTAEAAVRASGLDYLMVRPLGLDPAAEAKNEWHTLAADDRKGPLQLVIAKADVGKFLLEEALRPTVHSGDVQIGWKPAPKEGKN